MPGIVGLITKMPRQHAEQALLHKVEALSHEDFYVAGTLIGEFNLWTQIEGHQRDSLGENSNG